MGEVRVMGPESPSVQSAEEMIGQFQAELISQLGRWKQQISDDPSQLETLEHDVHAAFARGADLLVAGLVAIVMKQAEFQKAAKKARKNYRFPLDRGCNRQLQIRLLGGLMIWVTSMYCAPRRRSQKQEENVPGLHIELAQFGFGKACSPGLQSRVARQAALCPSLQLATDELTRGGVKLDVKTVRRIAQQCGDGLLALRRQELLLWREGKLPAGSELRGKRVSVQIDGGRTKIRGDLQTADSQPEPTDADGLPVEDVPGRSRKRPKKTFDSQWREPKLVTIFVHNEKGKMEKQSQATIEGTFEGPDAIAEFIAMHLHRLGAAEAESVTFVADGAPWIWDRIETIVREAKLEKPTIHEVLDCCHAAHHISLALASEGLNEKERLPLYREYRTKLRNDQWTQVVEDLQEFAADGDSNAKLETEIAYLQKHGEAGRMKYPYFRSLGLPLGSGAIESSIRRVINLRLKSNGIFWKQENAESMLQLRSLVISGRWNERLTKMRQHAAYDGRTNWRETPRPMSTKVEAELQQQE